MALSYDSMYHFMKNMQVPTIIMAKTFTHKEISNLKNRNFRK